MPIIIVHIVLSLGIYVNFVVFGTVRELKIFIGNGKKLIDF